MTRFLSCKQFAFCFLALALGPWPCFAQSGATGSTNQQASSANEQIPPAIAKELDAMKKRIDELEAELKSKNAQQPQAAAAQAPTSATSPATVQSPALEARRESSSAGPAPVALRPATFETAKPEKKEVVQPFSDWDWTWLNGNPRTKEIFWDSKFFTPEIRADIDYVADFNHPADHSMGGSSELFRSQEVQLEQLGVGGDFHYDNVRARLMTQFGMYSATTPRNDPSPGHGQWDLVAAYRYLSEAYGGYHFDVMHGVNVDAGIFMSYIGLFSYYNFDNWAYQPSYVSSNTPWFFNGVRVQIFPTAHLKIEPWFINGWQSYGSANHTPGLGGQLKWTPKPWIDIVSNNYGLGQDELFVPGRERIHTDDSIEIKYYDKPDLTLDKMAFSLTGDLGCEFGGGVSCYGNKKGGPKQSFVGFMAYNRFWFHKDLFGLTLGGGKINNPGRYLVLLPPINGETAITAATSSPYFTENPGDPFKAWDSSVTFDYMPKQYITFRWEYDYRHASVPYWSGRGGITPPGGNTGSPEDFVCNNGVSSGATVLASAAAFCTSPQQNSSVWFPDLRKNEQFIDLSILVKF
ncbi:MAG TPA: outer membrane beta-barrel protein [Candidatus Sulfotelmatobacter sp.]|nr:outer membrane beta-barrel protein [Candidatus Sulfotelmatobacter sp.]